MLDSTRGAPIMTDAGAARRYQVLGDAVTCLYNGNGAGPSWALFTIESPPGSATPPHVHETYDEAMYVIEGRLEIQVGERTAIVGPGHFVHVPKNTLHAVKNVGDAPARCLSWSLPGLAEAFYADVDSALRRGDASLEAICAIAERHGTRARI